jgi:hypothetical protein
MRDPKTPAEWREAVDAAEFLLALESCRMYGLLSGVPPMNVDRCEEILAYGKAHGIFPPSPGALAKKFFGGGR